MGQEFTIKSELIESKINQLLPSQGGYGAGIDFSASTTVIPIIDLTETAEGSVLRQDLQSSFSHDSLTSNTINNATRTVIQNTPGYWRIFGTAGVTAAIAATFCRLELYDGATYKILFEPRTIQVTGSGNTPLAQFDIIVKLAAGDSITGTANTTSATMVVASRQLADVSGNLVNP